MRKKFAYVITISVCLALAQVGLTLWQSFGSHLPNTSAGSNWLLELYNPMVPIAAVDWVTHAIAIAFVVAFAVTLRHRWGFSTFVSFIVAGAAGAVVIPLFLSAVHVGAFESYEYTKTYAEAFSFMTSRILMTQRAMVAHVITAVIAAMLGIAFGQHLTMDTPARPSTLGVIATHALAIVRRLLRRDPQAMLKAVEA
ncbi:MAG: hypothetical protein HYT39_03280 [Candidatus Sungbacteria bacterium]|nr:hypothetical protein [Candidatus Sungbacteria bacterium]